MTNQELIQKRKAGLHQLIEEAPEVISSFAKGLGVYNTAPLQSDAQAMFTFLEALAPQIQTMNVAPDDFSWLAVRLAYCTGQYFILKYEGFWGVNENPQSAQFGHYVVFARSPQNPEKAYPIDIFEGVAELLSAPVGRDMMALITEIEAIIQ